MSFIPRTSFSPPFHAHTHCPFPAVFPSSLTADWHTPLVIHWLRLIASPLGLRTMLLVHR